MWNSVQIGQILSNPHVNFSWSLFIKLNKLQDPMILLWMKRNISILVLNISTMLKLSGRVKEMDAV